MSELITWLHIKTGSSSRFLSCKKHRSLIWLQSARCKSEHDVWNYTEFKSQINVQSISLSGLPLKCRPDLTFRITRNEIHRTDKHSLPPYVFCLESPLELNTRDKAILPLPRLQASEVMFPVTIRATRNHRTLFLCFADRASQYNLSN